MWTSMLILAFLSLFFGSVNGGLFLTSESGNLMYLENTLEVDWYEALRICLSHNMSLISPDTEEKNKELTKLIGDINVTLHMENFWTSGQEIENFHYVWVSTGNNISWSNWRPNEPSRENCEKTQCIGFFIDAWASYTCTQPKNFICEENVFLRYIKIDENDKCLTRYKKKLQHKENEQTQIQLTLAKRSFEWKTREFPMLREFYEKELQLLEEKVNLTG